VDRQKYKEMKNMKYNIKPYLKERGYNLSSLAKKLGMSFQRFDHHIKPKNNISVNMARTLADMLGMTLENFISAVEVKKEDDTSIESDTQEEFDNQPFGD
jgi:plasmid maintenance system antidote protein VapI